MKVWWFGVLQVGLFGVALGACSGSELTPLQDSTAPGPLMRPGENCLRCHTPGGAAAGRPWSAAGTVFSVPNAPTHTGLAGAQVWITDQAGKRIELVTNAAGNFYTAEGLTPPLNVSLHYQGVTREMPIGAPAGSCNFCHSHPDPSGNATGRISVNIR